MGQEYYERLGVSSDASADEIVAAYREQLKETHPDVNDASDAGERTKRLIKAKEVLTDEAERARYDRLGHDRYVSIEQGETPDSGAPPRESEAGGTASAPGSGTASPDDGAAERSTDASNKQTGGHRKDARGTRGGRGVDWGTHTAREGQSRRTDGIDWEEWDDADWEEVSEAVWQDIAGDGPGESRHTAAGWGRATDRDNRNRTSTGTAGTTDQERTGPTGHARDSTGPNQGGGATTADAAGGGATAASAAGGGARPGGAETDASTADRGDWSVGWYSGGDPSGTTRDAYSFGSSDLTDDSWGTWSPGSKHRNRHGNSTFPPHRILSPVQSAILFCLCFVTYPLLVTGSVFPLLSSPVRLLLAMFLVFVLAILIILSQLGVAVFAGWLVLFPVVFAHLGVSLFAPSSLLTIGAVLVSLGLAGLSWLVIRPPVL